jgi:hypothetical protein
MMHPMNAAEELKLYIDNDGALYRSQTTSILKNLVTKRARGEYRHDLAVKAFGYLTEAGAKKYAKEHGSPDLPWNKMFDVTTRKRAAEALTRNFEGEAALGNYDHLLPKKYQKQEKTTGHATKKTFSRPGSRGYYVTVGGKIYGAQTKQARLAIRREGWPFAPITRWDGFEWHDTGRALYPAEDSELPEHAHKKATSKSHAAVKQGYRPINDHARKKSPAQLKHDIAAVLGTRRYS